jgi:endoglucanase
MATALAVVLAVAVGVTALSLQGSRDTALPAVAGRAPAGPAGHARYDARAFLTRYLGPDGRVVRRDQGGDTVSEGQAYAMLLAVAIGDATRFDLAWQWERAHLQRVDGLFSYHWAGGTVVGADPATDADLDTAWALALAARRFDRPDYRAAALRVASAVLAQETVTVGGHSALVAGPWARVAPYTVDPSYVAPEAMAALRRATGDARWSDLETESTALVAHLQSGPPTRLPPDWAALAPLGTIQPAGPPSTSQAPAYGLDAQRVPVWLAADCISAGRATAAAAWPLLEHAAGAGAALSYTLTGKAETRTVNPLGDVAAAAAAAAAGQPRHEAALLGRADAQAAGYHTYYGDAWVALGRVLLDTTWLSPCPPVPH